MAQWKEFVANLRRLLFGKRKVVWIECGTCKKRLPEQESLAFQNSPGRYCGIECFLESTLEQPL